MPSCSDNSDSDTILDRVSFKPGPLDTVYKKLRPAIQVFTIDNSKATVVKAAKGTEVYVPANCFTDGSGSVIKGNIQIEIIEAFTLGDFITSGLATLSGNQLLISNGMMYINARSGDKPLQLNQATPLTVSMPTMGEFGSFQMFTGDGSDWKADSSMTGEDYSIPLPLNLLYPEGNKAFWTCIQNSGGKDEKWSYLDTNIVSLTDRKYENTIIATHEFGRRFDLLRTMMDYMSYFANSDYYFDKADCMNQKFNYAIWKVYYENPNRSFRESDSIARKIYIEYFRNNKQKIEVFCQEVNVHKREYFSNWTDTNYFFDYRKISLEDTYMQVLDNFPGAAPKEIKLINDHGVDLNSTNAYDQLKQKNVDEKEINEILSYNFKRQSLVSSLERRKKAMEDEKKVSELYETTIFSVGVMGWINCDRFYNDPEAGKADMYVSNSSETNLTFIDCSLVIPDMNARLKAFPGTDGSYTFTQMNGVYTKLPLGQSAVIVGLSYQNDSLFFASRRINIKDQLRVALPMQPIRQEDLKDSLSVALKKQQAL